MVPSAITLALGLPGTTEWVIILVLGLLLFGRRLPDVGRSLGKTIRELRGGMDKFRQELNSDKDFREAQEALRDVKKAVDAPRKFADPKRLITDLAKSEPVPDPVAEEIPDKVIKAVEIDKTPEPEDRVEPG